jgi:hypothetical protein
MTTRPQNRENCTKEFLAMVVVMRRTSWRERVKSKWFLRSFKCSGVLLLFCALEGSLLDDYWIKIILSAPPCSSSAASSISRTFRSSTCKFKYINEEEGGTHSSVTQPDQSTKETIKNSDESSSSSQTTQQPPIMLTPAAVDHEEKEDPASTNSSTTTAIPNNAMNRLSTADTGTCVTPELHGQWDFQDRAAMKHTAPFCCDIESTYPLNHEFCKCNISSDYRLEFRGLPDRLTSMGGRGCGSQCQRHFADEFRWNSTNLPIWDATDFCTRLGDRRILMIGDSTMSQAATTLMNAAHVAQCQTQMFFFLSDTLLNQEYGNLNRGEHWLDLVANHSKRDDDIIVLTVGGHVLKQRDLSGVSDTVIQQMVELRKKRPGLQFVYKSQQPGGCTPQIANVSWTPSEAARQFPWRRKLFNFNYPLMYEYDERTIRKLQAHNIPFLDMRMLYSRSDAHPYSRGRGKVTDCLHFCSPGPLDVFPSLFMRLLQRKFAVPQCI